MQLSNLNGWRAVETVCRLGSIAAAAEELGVTRAAVAAQLRALEERLGQSLFHRNPGGLVPIDELRALSGKLTSAMSSLSESQHELTQHKNSHRVSVSVTQTFAETWLPRHLQNLFSSLGQIDLNLNTTWDVVDLRDPGLDFAIRYAGEVEDEIEEIPLIGSGVVPVCTREFADRYALTEAHWDLSDVPLVHINVPTSDPNWADWTRWADEMGVPISQVKQAQPKYELTGSSVRLAMSGVGLVLGGLSEIFPALQHGNLVMPFGKKSVFKASYEHKLIWVKGRRLGPVQKRFRDWVSARAAEDRVLMDQLFGA